MSNIRYYLRIMKKSNNKSNVFRKQDVELYVKQSDVGRGVAVDNGSPTASYTTCRPNDVDDIAERNNDVDDAAESVLMNSTNLPSVSTLGERLVLSCLTIRLRLQVVLMRNASLWMGSCHMGMYL